MLMAARDDAAGGTSCARRRRERRLRSMLRHERMAVAMALAEALHHSSGLKVMERAQHAALRGQKSGTRAGVAGPAPVTGYVAPAPAVAPFSTSDVSYEAPAPVVGFVAPSPAVTYAAPAPVVGYVAPSPAVTYAAPVPVIDYVAPAPSVAYAEPAPVFEYVAPAPVLEYIAPAPAVFVVAPSQQLRPAFTAAAVSTGVNLDAEFGCSASQVNLDAEFVGSASQVNLDAEFVGPASQVNLDAEFVGPASQVNLDAEFVGSSSQASPHVVSSGDIAEDFAVFPVVQEQVLVGERPAPLSEVAGPHAAVTVGYVAAAVPRLTPVVMEQGPAHDNSTSAWLLARALEEQQQYEEEVRHGLEVERLQVEQLEAERRLRGALEEFRDSPSRPSWSSCSPVTKAAVHLVCRSGQGREEG